MRFVQQPTALRANDYSEMNQNHPAGAAPLTGLSVAMLLERLLGLDDQPPAPPGLYFPYQLLDATAYLKRLEQEGGELRKL